jgi:uncharacterized protein YciW
MDSEPPDLGDLKSDDRRSALVALRDELADALKDCTVGVKAQLAAQYRATLKELAELPDAKKVTKADELANRRKARLAAAAAPASSGTEGR